MIFKNINRLEGEIYFPGDKSITHRAIMFASLSNGRCEIKNLGLGRDNLSTIRIFRDLGIEIKKNKDRVVIFGRGLNGLKEPQNILDAENSGTTIRILSGILSAQPFFSVITGDKYLVKRPMKRVIEPLSLMGAEISGREGNRYPPLAIKGNPKLKAIEYELSIASAQVKSAILMAGMYAEGTTVVSEPSKSRDHTERFMKSLGLPVKVNQKKVSISKVSEIPSFDIVIPGDISSSAFFMVAGSLIKGSHLILKNVGINPTRTGIVEVLKKMGADISVFNERYINEEPVGDILVKGTGSLKGVEIKGDIIPRLIDEIPVIAVAGAFAEGVTLIDDAEELRVKESDRIKAMVTELKKMGVDVEELPKGMLIKGGRKYKCGKINTYGDHRVAMAMIVFGLISKEGVMTDDRSSIEVSFPDFIQKLNEVIK
ncbi:MAG: 3-phosphoshikimate 1-carboxyvinyltransferase [Proteobacteria bacterium]|nr:3-phosphoshikimate 1-carboxyvinyltransferase [Pseudomonadota bacterium]